MHSSEDTRQRLIETAGPIFAEKGFRATTVREISERAEVNLASINYHFGDKESLYLATVHHAGLTCQQRIPLPEWEPGTPPAQKLHGFITVFLNRVAVDHEPVWIGQLITRELIYPTRACEHFVREFARPNFEMLDQILCELLGPDVPPTKRQLVIFSIIGQCLHYRFCRPVIHALLGPEEFAKYNVELLSNHITAFTLAALATLRRDERTIEVPS